MASFHLDPTLPEVSPAQRLAGWHREFCVELLGNSEARVFVRAVAKGSLKATELQRAILFQRVDTRFTDLSGCAEALRADLEQLVDTAQRTLPSRDNLFTTLAYDQSAWERVVMGIDRWARRRIAEPPRTSRPAPHAWRTGSASPPPLLATAADRDKRIEPDRRD